MENKLTREQIREQLKPVFEALINSTMLMYNAINSSSVSGVDDKTKTEIVENIMNSYISSIKTTMEQIVPNDIEDRIKEASNGR